MKSIYLILTIVFLLISTHCSGYDCKDYELGYARKVNFLNSNTIFYGVLNDVTNNIANFTIINQYKGNNHRNAIVRFLDNSIDSSDIFSLWIIYGNKSKTSDTIIVSECSISRNTKNPFVHYAHRLPFSLSQNEMELKNQIYKIQWLHDFYEEVAILETLKNTNSESKKVDDFYETERNKFQNWIGIINLVLVLSCLFLLLTFYFRNRNKRFF